MDDWKIFEKIIQELLLMFYKLKKFQYAQHTFQKLRWMVRKTNNYLTDSKQTNKNLALSCSKKISLGGFCCLNCFFLEHKINLNLIKKYVKIKFFVELQCLPKKIYQNLINRWSQIKCNTLFMLTLNLWLKNWMDV